MSPHEKAIEAAQRAARRVNYSADPFDWIAPAVIAAFLASARESGWELRPREAFDSMCTAGWIDKRRRKEDVSPKETWRTLFDAATRFEDAP